MDLSNAKTHWCFNKDIVHLMFACRQTAAVSKHVTECVVLTRRIFQMIPLFLYNSARAFFPHAHGDTGAKNKLKRSFFPTQRVIYIYSVL